jgi:hypothetical protein
MLNNASSALVKQIIVKFFLENCVFNVLKVKKSYIITFIFVFYFLF